MSWWFARGWEEYFTVVQWDQRAAGKTHLLTDPARIAPTLTRARMIADTEEIATWIRQAFGKTKIFVLGHSWGSFLGLQIARRHPAWLHAYIGVAQLIDGPESERRGWRFAIDAARRAVMLRQYVSWRQSPRMQPADTSFLLRTCTSSVNGSLFTAGSW